MEKEKPREGKKILSCWSKFITAVTFRDLKITIPKADV